MGQRMGVGIVASRTSVRNARRDNLAAKVQKGYPGIRSLGSLKTVDLKDINVLPSEWGADEEQLVSLDPVVQRGPVTAPAPVPTPVPADGSTFQVFRRMRATRVGTKIVANLGNSTGTGRQTFDTKGDTFSVGNMTYEKRASVKCCNSFQCLQAPEFPMFGEDPEFDPIRMASPLTVKGLGGLSRDEWDSGIPVMGGVAGGKKAAISGIPVMGGVIGGRTYADVTKKNCKSGKSIAKNVERKNALRV